MMTKIYEVKKGYDSLGSFEDLTKATMFFGELIKSSGKKLISIDQKKGDKKTYYWGNDVEFSIEIKDVDLYPSKKDAEYAIFEEGSK